MSKTKENILVPRLRFPEFQNQDQWTEKKFDDLCKFIRGPFGGALKKEIFVSEGYAVYEQQHAIYGDFTKFRYFISEEKFNEMKRFSVLPKDIIMSCSGTMGKFAVVPEKPKKGVINQALLKLTVKSGYEVGFIKTTLELPVNQNKLLSQSAGGAIKNVVEVAQIKEIKLLIPPIKEQQKIAACLSSLDEVISAESQKLDLLKDHKRGLLQNLLPVDNESVPKFRFEEFQDSDEWIEDTLLNIASFRRGSFPQPYGLPEWYDDDGMPFIQVFDVGEDFRLKPTTKNKISELAAKQSIFIPKGTLIITLQGSIGRVAITQYDAFIDRTLLLFEDFHKEIDLTFFAYTIFLLFEIEKQKAPGGIIKTITKEVLSSFVVKIPSIQEQKKIASCLSSLDELIYVQSQKVEALKLHKKGLLQDLFPDVNKVTA